MHQSAPRSSGFALRRSQLFAAFAAAAAISFLFRGEAGFLFRSWQQDEYSHGLLVPLVTLFLIWQRWPQMRQLGLHSSWHGLPVVAGGLALLMAGRHEPTLACVALVLTIAGGLLTLIGPRAFRMAIAPLALLLFAIPLPPFLHAAVSAWLQDASAGLGVAIMRVAGVSVLLQDGVIDLGHSQLNPGSGASNLKFVLPLLTLGAVATFLVRGRFWIRCVLVLSTIPLAIGMQGLRIAAIGVMADSSGVDQTAGVMPWLEGWASYIACVALLMIEAWLLLRLSGEPRRLMDTLEIDWSRSESMPATAGATGKPSRGKLLFVTSNFAPELTGIGKYMGEMTAWLAQAGFEIRVITAPPYYPAWRVPAGYSPRSYMTQRHEDVLVIRCPLLVPRRPRGLTRLAHMLSFAASTLPVVLWQCVAWRPQLVFVVEPPLSCAPAAWLGARLCGARCWLHVQDFEVDAAFDLGLLRGRALRDAALGTERWLMRRFDRVSSISPRMLRKLVQKGARRARVEYFPNWVDTAAIRPGERDNALRRELGIPADVNVLLYSGNMGEKQGLELLVEAARLLRHSHPDVLFLLCGDGAARKRAMDAAADLGNVRFIPLQPLAVLNELLNLADVHLLPQRKDAEDLVMPSKLTAILSSGRPVVASARPHSDLGRAAASGGIIVPPGDAEAFAGALRQLLASEKLRDALGASGRRHAIAEWDRDSILQKAAMKLDVLLGQDVTAMADAGAARPASVQQ